MEAARRGESVGRAAATARRVVRARILGDIFVVVTIWFTLVVVVGGCGIVGELLLGFRKDVGMRLDEE